ncbi:MAG: bacteriocin [Limnochordia bacterium]|jgi:bacteriocin-like protein
MSRQEFTEREGRKDEELLKKERQDKADTLSDKELDTVTGGSRRVTRPPIPPRTETSG